MNEDYPSAVTLANDYPKRTPRKVGHRCGAVVSNGKARDATNQRIRRSKVEARKSEASEQEYPRTIPDLLRAIEGLGCRVIQIENLAWQIESSEASRGSCLLIGSDSRKQSKTQYAMRAAVQGWGEAKKRVAEAEMEHARFEEVTRVLVRMDEVREVFGKWLGAIRNLMDAMPSSLAARANPSDPECAKRAIQEGIDQIFVTIQKAEGAFK